MKISAVPVRLILGALVVVSCLEKLSATIRFGNDDEVFAEQSYYSCTSNVSVVDPGGFPGSLVLTETRAFAMVLSSDTTIVGAGGSLHDIHGGRVAAFTHGSFLGAADTEYDLGTLMVNVARWGGKSQDPRVALHAGASELTDLAAMRFGNFSTAPAEVSESEVVNGDLNTSRYDIFFAHSSQYDTPEELAALRTFLEAGGGLVFYGTSWAYDYPNGFEYELDYPANVVMMDTGVTVLGGVDWDFTYSPWDMPVNFSDPIVNNAGYAVAVLEAKQTGSLTINAQEELAAANAVMQAVDDLMDIRKNLTNFFAALDDLAVSIKNATSFSYPSRTNTFNTEADPMVSFLLTLETQYALNLPYDQLEAHPGHKDYPGEVPAGAIPEQGVQVEVRGQYEGLSYDNSYANAGSDRWTSTALYLVAGSTMSVTLPAGHVDEGIAVRVGCHKDDLSSKTSLNRMPVITRSWSLDEEVTVVGSAFGGMVYITVPWGANTSDFTVVISGAVRSLQYKHNSTSLAEWSKQIGTSASGNFNTSLYPPWGELVSDKFIMSLPTSTLLTVFDPVDVMNYWETVMDAEDSLAGYPSLTWRGSVGRAERLTVDVQISAGWMHSGYPYMAYDSTSDGIVDIPYSRLHGQWGAYHELGHNHQQRPWIVMDSTEVGCNYFSAYVEEAVNGNPIMGTEDYGCEQTIRNYLAVPDYDGTLSGDVWMHLYFYLLIKQAFGWGVIQQSLTSYVDGSDLTDYSELSSTEKVDPLLIKLAVNSGHNLVPYARAWDYPLSEEGAAAIEALDLPEWDYNSTLTTMEQQLYPSRECYSPVNEKLTLVQYEDVLLGNNTNMWHYSTYRGVLNTTEGGLTCQRWDVQTPHTHSYGPDDYECRGLVGHNYCRTNGEDRPWCYTTDPDTRWDFCELPLCEKMTVPATCSSFTIASGYQK